MSGASSWLGRRGGGRREGGSWVGGGASLPAATRPPPCPPPHAVSWNGSGQSLALIRLACLWVRWVAMGGGWRGHKIVVGSRIVVGLVDASPLVGWLKGAGSLTSRTTSSRATSSSASAAARGGAAGRDGDDMMPCTGDGSSKVTRRTLRSQASAEACPLMLKHAPSC